MMMRGGYRSHYPATVVKDDEVEKSRIKDEESKTRRCDLASPLNLRRHSAFAVVTAVEVGFYDGKILPS